MTLESKRDGSSFFHLDSADRSRIFLLVSLDYIFGLRMLYDAVNFAESASHTDFFLGMNSFHFFDSLLSKREVS